VKIEGVILKSGEIPKKLFKVISGTVRETRQNTYHDLVSGDYIALMEYLLSIPLEEDIVAIEESEIVEIDFESEYLNIVKKIVELRKLIDETSIDIDNMVLSDFNFENIELDDYLNQIEQLLTLAAGELPDDVQEALKQIEQLEDDKIITKVNLVRRFIEKFPDDESGPRLLIETASKVYLLLNDRYLTKALLKKVLINYSQKLDYCYEATKILKTVYEDEGNILWRRYEKIAKVIEVILRGNA